MGQDDVREVIGVAADSRYARVTDAPRDVVFLPFFQQVAPRFVPTYEFKYDGTAAEALRVASDAVQCTVASCRSDFFGERGVCTRPCNHGCPIGFECVAEIPDYNGGTIRDVCMLACPTNECAPLGSSCNAPGDAAGPRYCF